MNYLYNGVPLPDIYSVYTPELQATHPFAYICKMVSTERYFFVCFDTAKTEKAFLFMSPGAVFEAVDGSWAQSTSGGLSTTCVWCNTDIVGEDDTIYLAASDPIPILTRTPAAMLMGFQLGTAIRRMRGMKQPVAFLYGPDKVRLPKIPTEVAVYPYLILQYLAGSSGGTILAYGYENKPNTVLFENLLQSYEGLRLDSGTYRAGNWYSTLPNEWYVTEIGNVTDASGGYHMCSFGNLIWANFDIYALDGTLFLPKSEPVPVYE